MSDRLRSSIPPNVEASNYSQLNFVIKALISDINTSMPCAVRSVTNNGSVSPIGYVDIQPLVNQMDGAGNLIPHSTIFNVPYMRIQGGGNAVIIDPQVGDIGIVVFCQKDITKVKNTKGLSGAGSRRKFDMSDAVYLHTIISAAPTQYVQFNSAGITIHSPSKVTINAPSVQIDASTSCSINSPIITLNGQVNQGSGSYGGNAAISGTLTATVDVVAGGKSLKTHIHSGVTAGGGNTGSPV
jgi:hypothetical protein